MRTLKIAGLILAGVLAISSTAFAGGHGGGGFGGGHGGGGFGGGHFGGGGGHFGGGGAHFDGGGAHFGGGHFAASHFAGGHYGWNGGHDWHGGHGYGGRWYGGGWYGGPYWWGYPFGVGNDDYYGYYDAPDAYSDDQSTLDNTATSAGTVVAAQKELTKLGYYHGSIDGIIGPETQKAVRWFQSVDKLQVTGQLDDQTLKALQIS
jgi:hypothetical protein